MLLICLSISSSAHARKVRKLDNNIIKAFIQKTSRVSGGLETSMSQSDVLDFLERHIHDDAHFSSYIRFQIPGQEPQVTNMELQKSDFLEQTQTGQRVMDNYYNEVTVEEIKIAGDKRKANVKTTSKESGSMNVPDGVGGMRSTPVKGTSTCHQVITISKRHVVQLYNADCETHIFFE